MKKDNFEKINYGKEFIENVVTATDKKVTLSSKFTKHYILRAMMAGFIIALMYVFYLTLKTNFEADPAAANLIAAFGFSFTLAFIYFTNSELATSNFMILTVGKYYNQIK